MVPSEGDWLCVATAYTARSMLPWQWLQATTAVLDMRTIVECSPQFGHTDTSSYRCKQ